MTTAAKVSTLAEALVSAWAEMPVVDKTAKGNFGQHLELDQLISKTRPILHKHNLAIVQLPARGDDGMPVLRTTILHSSGESISADAPLAVDAANNRNSASQLLGISITYMRRYAWASACGIASEHDNDAQKSKDSDIPEPLRSDERAQERRELQEAVQAGIDRLGPVDATWSLVATLQAASKSFGRQITAISDLDEDELSKILTALSLAEEQLVIEEVPA